MNSQERKKKLFSELRQELERSRTRESTAYREFSEVISRGFKEWLKLLCAAFPGFRWRGSYTREANVGFDFETYIKVLYERFFAEIAMNVLTSPEFTPGTVEAIRKECWKNHRNEFLCPSFYQAA